MLRRLFSRVDGGTWGSDPDSDEINATVIRAADFDYARLRVSTENAPERAVSRVDMTARGLTFGDLIIEKSGGGELQPVGRTVRFDLEGFFVPSNFAARLRPMDGCDSRFVCYLLASLYSEGVTRVYIKQTTGIQNLDLSQFLAEKVSIPNLRNQRVISKYLDRETLRLNDLIAKKSHMIELLDERFEIEIFRAVTGGLSSRVDLRSVTVSWIDKMPRHWSLPPVAANYEVQLGKMLNAEASSGSDHFPYLRNANVQWDRIELGNLATMSFDKADRRRYRLRPGDLLVCEGGEVGRAAVWDGRLNDCFFQKAIHRVRPRRGNARFLMYCLRAAAKQNVFAVEGNQSTIVHLTAEKLRVHRFPFPPIEEQRAIVEYLDARRDETTSLQSRLLRQITLLQERRHVLITAAVTGQLDIPGVAA